MTKRIDKVYDENLIEALKKLPFPIRDEKHNLNIVLLEEDVRKDQNRFEHVSKVHHKLKIRDIESIPESIKKKPILLKDSGREQTYNYYLKRKGDRYHFIKISIKIIDYERRIAKIKTIFLTKVLK